MSDFGLRPFYSFFPELGAKETRVAIVQGKESGGMPPGRYAFIEFYCANTSCDCRRVIFQVVEESSPNVVQATIFYGWENAEFYERWTHGDQKDGVDCKGPGLELLGEQSKHADELLDLFSDVILQDAAYIQRLQRHYLLMKQEARAKALRAQSLRTGKKRRK